MTRNLDHISIRLRDARCNSPNAYFSHELNRYTCARIDLMQIKKLAVRDLQLNRYRDEAVVKSG